MVASTTPVQLQQCLNEVDFPADKQDLIDAADRTGCDGETIRVLRSLPRKTYNNVSQVTASVTVADNRDLNGGETVR